MNNRLVLCINSIYDNIYTWHEKTQKKIKNIIENIDKRLNTRSGIEFGRENGEEKIQKGLELFGKNLTRKIMNLIKSDIIPIFGITPKEKERRHYSNTEENVSVVGKTQMSFSRLTTLTMTAITTEKLLKVLDNSIISFVKMKLVKTFKYFVLTAIWEDNFLEV